MISINNLRTIQDRDRLLEELSPKHKKERELISKLKVIKIVLAFNPTQGVLDLIHDFFLKNYQSRILVDVEVDSEIIGGAKIFFNGKYFDSTILKKINEKF